LTLDRALTLDELIGRHSLGDLTSSVWSLDEVLRDLPALVVDGQAAARVSHGAPVGWANVVSTKVDRAQHEVGMPVRIHDGSGRLLGVGRLAEPRAERILIEKVFVTESV
jgi:hypothetical protein